MKFIRGFHNFKQYETRCALTIGNFDGLHLGHQALIRELISTAKEKNLPTVLMTFEPHPDDFFSKNPAIRLLRARDKFQELKNLGLDYVICIRFNSEFSKISAEEFIEKILISSLGVKALIIGDDFRFGAKRLGDVNLLKKFSEKCGFILKQMPSIQIENDRVSSTQIRNLLEYSQFSQVARLLGRSFAISGRVTHGDKRGRVLGFPTANIVLPHKIPPIRGIFVVLVKGLKGKALPAVASLGTRPMYDGKRFLLEVNIFDFDEWIYGKLIQVEFLKKIRDEKMFDSEKSLIEEMSEDVKKARKFFENAPLSKFNE